MNLNYIDKNNLLIFEASRWVGFTEIGPDNKGQMVEYWQKSVDKVSSGESWCLSFVMSSISTVDWMCQSVFNNHNLSNIYKTEHCLTCWTKTPKIMRLQKPIPGSIAIWNYKGTTNGHAGIVKKVIDDKFFITIEGNTSPGGLEIDRNGDGVYEKKRSMDGSSKMILLGFLSAWA